MNTIRRRSHCGVCECRESQIPPQLDSTLICAPLKGLSLNKNIHSSSFIPDLTSLYNMRVGEVLKEDLGHMEQFQVKVMSGGGGRVLVIVHTTRSWGE